ncbi:MAG: FGGY family carbohydrate kinase [Lachnospiraceae bacterium]|jgi:xylulokinase|nr:FGGY family carbohydrate kinase [Lachnospiraceae bacterium]
MFLTLDVGTTAVKAGLFDEKLNLLHIQIEEYELLCREGGRVEQSPKAYWEKTVQAVRHLLRGREKAAAQIRTITCTTQGETLIPVDKQGNALSDAVVWLDSRASREAEQIKAGIDPLSFYRRTGQPEITGSMPLCKLVWFRENRRELYEKTWKFLLLEDYLVFLLCKKTCSNPSLMSSTGYFDVIQGGVWGEILDMAGIDRAKIPEIQPCGTILGRISREAAAELGISQSACIVTGAMDQAASAVGAGNLEPGMVTETTGTCQTVLCTCQSPEIRKLSPLTYYCHGISGKYLKLIYSETAGMALKWFRREFCADLMKEEKSFEQMSALAEKEPILSRGVIFYPHMAGTQIPRADSRARGVFWGAGLDSTRGTFVRAIMEGVGYLLRENLEAMGEEPERITALGGGAKSPVWCRIKAGICGIPVVTQENAESTSLGAAILGAAAAGEYGSVHEASEQIRKGAVFQPDREQMEKYKAGYETYKRMYWAFEPLYGKGGEEL